MHGKIPSKACKATRQLRQHQPDQRRAGEIQPIETLEPSPESKFDQDEGGDPKKPWKQQVPESIKE